jgi:hypothetical protein
MLRHRPSGGGETRHPLGAEQSGQAFALALLTFMNAL